MAKRRYQKPEPVKEGNWWYLLIRQDVIVNGRRERKKTRVKLVPATATYRDALKLRDEYVDPMNQGLQSLGSATKYMDFVKGSYIPAIMPTLSASTRDRYAGVLKNHLIPTYGEMPLRDITPLVVQTYFAGFAKKDLAHETVDKIRDVLSATLRYAKKYGYITENPAFDVDLPKPKSRKAAKKIITPEQFDLLVANMKEPYATMVYTAGRSGLRPSEVIALRWNDIHEDSITVDERCFRGDFSAPKSESSAATIAVERGVIERIHRLRMLTVGVKAGRATRQFKVVKSDGPEDLVFQSVDGGQPMRDNNILTRHIKPVAKELGFGWANWQVLRRSYATWLNMAGTDAKDIQQQMRHSKLSTTMDTYVQAIPIGKRNAADNLGRLFEKSSSTVN